MRQTVTESGVKNLSFEGVSFESLHIDRPRIDGHRVNSQAVENIYNKNLIDENLENWCLINDTVMGGLSESSVAWNKTKNHLQISGELFLQNNAGFVSMNLSISDCIITDKNKFCIKVKGDGRKYQFRLRTRQASRKYAYSLEFQTIKDQWQTFTFLPSEFVAKSRGANVSVALPLGNSQIYQIAFLLADKKSGRFKIDIESLFID